MVVVCAGAARSGTVAMALSFAGHASVKHPAAGFVAGWEKAGESIVR
jgi:rhodanese-related sulfurtransferase